MYKDNWLGYVALGVILKDENKINEATKLFEIALKKDPDNPYAKRFLDEINNRDWVKTLINDYLYFL